MEILTILLSGLVGLLSPLGLLVEGVAEGAIRSQFQSVEQVGIRVDNAPSYQIVQGKADRVFLALRGAFPLQDLRIAVLDVETDPVDLALGQGKPKLNRPFQAGIRLVLAQADLNRALQSSEIASQFRNIVINLPNVPQAQQIQRYDLLNPRLTVLENNRLRLQVDLQEQKRPDRLPLMVEFGLQALTARRLKLVEPVILIGGEPAPPDLLANFTKGINDQLDLQNLEKLGITIRVLKLAMTPEQQVEIAIFMRIETSSPLLTAGFQPQLPSPLAYPTLSQGEF
ncbi:hypothetical protein BST81_20875 [Leptolyngbya sp. 'hensonii']|uniref:LmeA family phospholipid-binding protein n=1 Tax=Leptolyngbya sp. 'hensonii' TaxID=1922337 RepID=UPI00094F57C6|nr:DUF2993 domain-containing protein [Leptolyngbya sp. 'hensonii']OLP16437.1 hypothetical protein BST81_20875 [Leptolyngbya sp. 'hensonii']